MAGSKARDQLSSTELSAFCTQISMILHAGISVSEGLSIMMGDVQNAKGRDLIEKIYSEVDLGTPLFQALVSTGVFPKYVVDMTEIGERTGRLDDVMASLSTYYQREESISRSIRNAVTYPLIMVGMMVVVILVLMVRVLPVFSQVFEQLGTEMSGMSQSMLNLGQLIGRYSYILILAAALIVAAILLLRATKGGQALFERMKRRIFRRLSDQIASERFASAMSLMLASGLDIDQSLEMCAKLVDSPLVRERIGQCQTLMAGGESFSGALIACNLFTGVHGRMVAVGFKAGAVDTVMERLAETYEDEIDSQIGNAISVLEPTLVAILSIVVGMILLSIMLPLMGIMSSIG